ncbi:hypothetical protein [Clostridium tagluense]|uniref:Uncharacterized protein n=1 Tax=Clostridium tagluense TaxID=360422 RepID=A0A401UTM5_9CLOT|nr:hypothetical protein [Clostridium tagluense]GCD12912.1 hypothetical protein Ctaglu_45350 [Clostridium tagluense]
MENNKCSIRAIAMMFKVMGTPKIKLLPFQKKLLNFVKHKGTS